MLSTSGAHALLYVFYCKYHILYRIYPGICESATELLLNHQWDLAVLPLTIIQFILGAQLFGSAIIYVLTAIVYILVGNELLVGIR